MSGPLRTLLFVPGDDERKVSKALAADADAVVVDLEDAVAPSSKPRAREIVAGLGKGRSGGPALMARINDPGGPFGREDLELAARLDLAAVVVPKATAALVAGLPQALPPLIPIVETARGVREAYDVACAPGVLALMFGAIDLAAEIDFRWRGDGRHLLYARSKVVLDSATAAVSAPIDTAWAHLREPNGLREEAELARDLGFQGKCCIHPDQLDIVRRAFDDDQTAWAQSMVNAYEAAQTRGDGVLSLGGEMVDMATIRRARRILAEHGPTPTETRS